MDQASSSQPSCGSEGRMRESEMSCVQSGLLRSVGVPALSAHAEWAQRTGELDILPKAPFPQARLLLLLRSCRAHSKIVRGCPFKQAFLSPSLVLHSHSSPLL